jgi:hypothetical protein
MNETHLSHEVSHRRVFVDKKIVELFPLVESKKATILGSGVPFVMLNELPVSHLRLVDSRQWVGSQLRDCYGEMMYYNLDLPQIHFSRRDFNWADDILTLSQGTTLIIPNSEYLVNSVDVINEGQDVIIVNECSGEVHNPRKVSCFYYIDEMKERFELSEYLHTSKEKFANREYIFMVGRK